MHQPGFFDFANRLKDLSSFGDPLERLSQVVDFEVFRKDLEEVLNLSTGGRPPYDAVLMFKISIVGSGYNFIVVELLKSTNSTGLYLTAPL